jgi:hypothetical protein
LLPRALLSASTFAFDPSWYGAAHDQARTRSRAAGLSIEGELVNFRNKYLAMYEERIKQCDESIR